MSTSNAVLISHIHGYMVKIIFYDNTEQDLSNYGMANYSTGKAKTFHGQFRSPI